MAEELDLSHIEVAPDKHSIFVITFPGRIREDQATRLKEGWKAAWKAVGRDVPPVVLVLDSGGDIKSLSNDGLRHLGLVRLTEPDELAIPDHAVSADVSPPKSQLARWVSESFCRPRPSKA